MNNELPHELPHEYDAESKYNGASDETINDGINEKEEKINKEQKEDLLKKHIEREAILDQIFDDNRYKKNDIIKDEKAKIPYKGIGVFTLLVAILGIVFIGLMIYFIILNPYYVKKGKSDNNLIYPELASDTNATELSTLLEPYDATVTDAVTLIEE